MVTRSRALQHSGRRKAWPARGDRALFWSIRNYNASTGTASSFLTVCCILPEHVMRASTHGLTFKWWGCCGLCTNRACPLLFLLCSYVYFCLYGPFYSISFIQNTQKRLKELILIGPKTVDFISFNKNFPTTLRILALFFWGPVLSVLLNMADHEPIVSVIFSLETPHTVE